jgi:6-phosphogluconate dehydrogenase
MELGMIGLGRMGGNMVRRLVNAGHTLVGNARRRETVARR